ncbi:hypothetical protein RRF57_009286 [Xylaria bambusicola]|uniref:Uncharacterized protein n=1 Tax=Xylaria bambusicola TaxID=326684 RepID=A0AAN7Z7R1_9PEZI
MARVIFSASLALFLLNVSILSRIGDDLDDPVEDHQARFKNTYVPPLYPTVGKLQGKHIKICLSSSTRVTQVFVEYFTNVRCVMSANANRQLVYGARSIQFYNTEIDQLREDANALTEQLVTTLLLLGVTLAEHSRLGDAEPPLREVRERMDADGFASYPIESLVYAQVLASMLQSRNQFERA